MAGNNFCKSTSIQLEFIQERILMNCNICSKKSTFIFSEKVLGKYQVSYFHCNHCGFVQTESPYWLDEAYLSPINISDTGYVSRNTSLSNQLTILLSLLFDIKGKYLDYAGGYGLFVRQMRDIGFDFYWQDKYAQNIFAVGFDIGKITFPCEAVTSFESFEHFTNPMEEIECMLRFSKSIILTTELLLEPLPTPKTWWYYGCDHGQHISFYSANTFEYISNNFGLNYYRIGNLHILTDNKDISTLTLKMLKLSKFGLHNLVKINLKSKTWEDHLALTSAS
jgi:hypothetical protein